MPEINCYYILLSISCIYVHTQASKVAKTPMSWSVRSEPTVHGGGRWKSNSVYNWPFSFVNLASNIFWMMLILWGSDNNICRWLLPYLHPSHYLLVHNAAIVKVTQNSWKYLSLNQINFTSIHVASLQQHFLIETSWFPRTTYLLH